MASPHDNNQSAGVGIFQLSRMRIPRSVAATLFVACLLTTLIAGLWPFSSPDNDATLLPDEDAIRFNLHGTAVSQGVLDSSDSVACAVEVRLQPARVWATGTPLAFYDSRTRRRFLVEQDYEDLVLQLAEGDQVGNEVRSLRVANVFREKDFLLTITSDGQETLVYVDGRLVTQALKFPLSGKDLTGRLILGNAPRRNHGWAGAVKGVAIYAHGLYEQQVLKHDRDWRGQQSALAAATGLKALYIFDEHSGRIVQNAVESGVNLEIPKKFVTIDQLLFEHPKSEAHADRHYVDDIVANILGFIPLGFAAALLFATLYEMKRAVVLATLVGAATSLTIEYFQAFLPTRYSGVTDLITNPLGTLIGALLYFAVAKVVTKTFGVERLPNPV
jgi:VanZ family protein